MTAEADAVHALAQQILQLSTDSSVRGWAQQILDATPASAPPPEAAAVLTLYEHDNFIGRSMDFASSTPNLAPLGFNDVASSAVVTGPDWEVWTDANYSGKRTVLTAGRYPSLRALGINDAVSSCRQAQAQPDTTSPPPAEYKYMASFGGSPDEVCRFVNIRFLPCWGTTDVNQMVDEFRRTKARGVDEVILNLDALMWNKGTVPATYLGSAWAMPELRHLFDALRAAGLLSMVTFLWAPDEPARDARISDRDLRQWVLDCKQVAAEYSELAKVRFGVIWGDEGDQRPAADLFDLQLLDHYDLGAGILGNAYPELEATLAPNQRSGVVPGMYTVEGKPMEIEAFLPYVLNNPRCQMLMVFLYDVAQGGYGFNGSAPRVMAVADAIKRANKQLT